MKFLRAMLGGFLLIGLGAGSTGPRSTLDRVGPFFALRWFLNLTRGWK